MRILFLVLVLFSSDSFSVKAYYADVQTLGGVAGFRSAMYSDPDKACRTLNPLLTEFFLVNYDITDHKSICGSRSGSQCWSAYNCETEDGYTYSGTGYAAMDIVYIEDGCESFDSLTSECNHVCSDGLLPYLPDLEIYSCDRYPVKECDDGSFVQDTVDTVALCTGDFEEPVCSDELSCREYALSQNSGCSDYEFEFTSVDSFELNCIEFLGPIDNEVIALSDPLDFPDPVADNPYETPDSEGVTAGDIAGAIQQSLAPDFQSVVVAITENTNSINEANNVNANEIKSGLSDIQTQIRSGDNSIKGELIDGNELLASIDRAVGNIDDALSSDDDGGSGAGYEPSDELTGFYTPMYPNGFADVMDNNKDNFENSALVSSLDDWNINIVADVPLFDVCLDISIVNFGCYDLMIPDYVLLFLKAILLFTTAIFCRQIIFGA